MTASRRAGFTLLELCLALLIGSMLILLAVPSISGMLAEHRLKESFERFDKLVATARRISVTEQRTCTLAWDKGGITLRSAGPGSAPAEPGAAYRLAFRNGESFELRRPASLQQNAPAEWAFWGHGICEPAQIAFQGPAGHWLVRYDPLTARGTFLQSELP